MASITFNMLVAHQAQAVAETLADMKARTPSATAEELAAYEAGLLRGWSLAVSDLKLHAGLRVSGLDDDKPKAADPLPPKPLPRIVPVLAIGDAELEIPSFLKRAG